MRTNVRTWQLALLACYMAWVNVLQKSFIFFLWANCLCIAQALENTIFIVFAIIQYLLFFLIRFYIYYVCDQSYLLDAEI